MVYNITPGCSPQWFNALLEIDLVNILGVNCLPGFFLESKTIQGISILRLLQVKASGDPIQENQLNQMTAMAIWTKITKKYGALFSRYLAL